MFYPNSTCSFTSERDLLNISLSNVGCMLEWIPVTQTNATGSWCGNLLSLLTAILDTGSCCCLKFTHWPVCVQGNSQQHSVTYLNHCLFIHQLRYHKCCLPYPVISRVAKMTWQWLQFCDINGRSGSTPIWCCVIMFTVIISEAQQGEYIFKHQHGLKW